MAATEAAAYPSPFVMAISAASRGPMEAQMGEGEERRRRYGVTEEDLVREGVGAAEHALRLAHLTKVLDFFGFREMASAAPLLLDSPVLAAWPGPWTVFGVPDAALQVVFSSGKPSELALLLLQHLALGAFTRDDITEGAPASIKLSTGVIGMCLTVNVSTDEPGVLRVDGVKVTYHGLYNDGRLVPHVLKGAVTLPSHGSCSDGSRRRRRPEHVQRILRKFFANLPA